MSYFSPIPGFLRKKLNGGALYIAVIISIIIGIILTMFILIARYNNRNVTVFAQTSQLHHNLKSAYAIAQSDYFSEDRNNKWFKNSINDDSIRIRKSMWGAYVLISVETKNRHQKLSQSGLYGTWMNADTALCISDNSRPVGLSGNVIFKAACYLSSAGIKPAYIEGQSYLGNPSNHANIRKAPPMIASPLKTFKEALIRQSDKLDPYNDSLVQLAGNEIHNTFNRKTVTIEQSDATLSNLHLTGNIKLIGKNITVDKSCSLENILIICDKIIFKEEFKGSLHVIARDSIILQKKAELNYPSSLTLISESDQNTSTKCIVFNEDCKLSGGIVAMRKDNNNAKVFVKLHSKSEISGLIYSEDYIHIEGKVNGTIISHSLLLKTPSAVYENHLLSCELDPKKYSHLLSVPLVFTKKNKLICSKTL